MDGRVELLSPAGNYEALIGALNAGADAVYLGGEKYGARAYADNFTTQEICRALRVAHFMGRKIYLTVNTLVKEPEAAALSAYLRPLYEAGLDGVIVQDLGVFRLIRRWFPELLLHVSTQMTVTGAGAAALLKEQGAVRIVPARELSLPEIRAIKEETGVEIECFIHGAMCYCYSGQCLFSSILGGRSGNRGRCAQPCRLPYRIYADREQVLGEGYPLSLKDMCTLEYIPQLIEAGIDSFKIEGRMKKPEYAAGATAVYRKYIDLYYCRGADGYRVEQEDLYRLRGLYIRGEIQTGYYERHNGKEMITLSKPGYTGSDEQVTAKIREAYLHEPDPRQVRLYIEIKAGAPMRARVEEAPGGKDGSFGKAESFENREEVSAKKEQIQIEITGETAQKARKAPLTEEDIRRQMTKTGNSCVTVAECEIHTEEDVFVPVRALNQLRRDAIEAYERAVILRNGFRDRRPLSATEEAILPETEETTERYTSYPEKVYRPNKSTNAKPVLHGLVTTCEQLRAVMEHGCDRIYIESDLFLREYEKIVEQIKSAAPAAVSGRPSGRDGDRHPSGCGKDRQVSGGGSTGSYYLALPHILRKRDRKYLQRLTAAVAEADGLITGFLLRNLEGLSYVRNLAGDYAVIPDAGLYCFHKEALKFWKEYGREFTLPYELNGGEAAHLAAAAGELGFRTTLIAYGRIPMMITANCLRKTAGICLLETSETCRQKISGIRQQEMSETCQQESSGICPQDLSGIFPRETAGISRPEGTDMRQIYLRDRYQTSFPTAVNCEHCYNIIYNSVPYSLHKSRREAERVGADVWRYDFVMESAAECLQILAGKFPYEGYTTGHLKRGIE